LATFDDIKNKENLVNEIIMESDFLKESTLKKLIDKYK
jgi:hypothetical protein